MDEILETINHWLHHLGLEPTRLQAHVRYDALHGDALEAKLTQIEQNQYDLLLDAFDRSLVIMRFPDAPQRMLVDEAHDQIYRCVMVSGADRTPVEGSEQEALC